jgi:ssDNA-binding Zn-finger/Zn-ribbon topoisomerase 1
VALPFVLGLADNSVVVAILKPQPRQSLADLRPELAAEWHPTLNGDLTPYDVRLGCNAEVWWRCSTCGNEWPNKVYKRGTAGRGCPRCGIVRRAAAQAQPRPGESLAEAAPAVAAEWHPTLNGDLTPEQVRVGSGKLAWWKCPQCEREWQTAVNKRGRGGIGCHKCAVARRAILRSTPKPGRSFAHEFPDAAAEWHPTRNGELTAFDVRPASQKRVWWLCTESHVWNVSPANRCRGEQCPECDEARRAIAKATPKPGRSLADLHPDIATEWHPTLNAPITAADVNPGARKKRWWQCKAAGHVWAAPPYKRANRGDGCPDCSTIGVSARQLRLEYELAAAGLAVMHGHPPIPVPQRRPVRADIVAPALHLVVEYDGVRFHATLDSRDRSQTIALNAAGWTVLRVRELPLHGLGGHEVFVTPIEPIKSVSVKVLRALANMGYTVKRLDEYISDPQLWAEAEANNAIHRYRTVSLASEFPTVAAELHPDKNHGITAERIHPGSHAKFVWTCSDCSHEWATAVHLRTTGSGCPRCGYRTVARKLALPRPGESFADLFPEAAHEWHPTRNGELTPSQLRAASNFRAWWLCARGHEWEAVVSTRRKSRCGECYKIDRRAPRSCSSQI